MKKMKFKCLTIALICMMVLCFVIGCADDGGNNKTETLNGTIKVVIPIGEKEKIAFDKMKDAYMIENPEVTIQIEDAADDSYTDWLSKQLAKDVNQISADIVVNNSVTQFFGDNKFVDYSDYLTKNNAYHDGEIWEDALKEQAYRPNGSKGEVYSLNFESNQMVFFYNKKIFQQAGLTVDGTVTGEPKIPTDWDELVACAKKISETKNPATNKNYIGFTISGDTDSFQNQTMGWLIRIYADQYFRSFINDVRAQKTESVTDYCYNQRVDGSWEYAPKASDYEGLSAEDAFQEAITNDSPRKVTANDVRTLQKLMNDEIGPNHPKYKDMMTNLLKLIPKYTNTNFFGCDQGTALGYFWNQEAGIYFGGTDIFKAYFTMFDGVAEAEKLQMGTFYCPPMKHTGITGGAPDIDITRGLGGPQGFYGIINKSQKQNDLCMDFMMYWASKSGQSEIFKSYEEQNWYINGSLFINGLDIPDAIHPTKDIIFQGECDLNPIQLVARGLGSEPTSIREYQTFSQKLFRGDIDVDNFCAEMQKRLKSSKDKYCAERGYNTDCYMNPHLNPFNA